MTQSLEILLDAELDATVRLQWQALTEAGLPSQGRHPGESNAPHITLAVATGVPAEIEDELHTLAAQVPLSVRLGGLLCFGRRDGKQILVRPVVVDSALLALQAEAARLYSGLPGIDALLAPGHWTPHVTLARGLTAAQVGTAIEALGYFREHAGQAVAIRRWDSVAKQTWVLGQNG